MSLRIKPKVDPEIAKQLDAIHSRAPPFDVKRRGSHITINETRSTGYIRPRSFELILPKGIEMKKVDVNGKNFLVFKDTSKKSPGFKVGNSTTREIYVSVPGSHKGEFNWSMLYKTKSGKQKSDSGLISNLQNFLDDKMIDIYSTECKKYGADRNGRVEIQGKQRLGKNQPPEKGYSIFFKRNEFTGKMNVLPGKKWRYGGNRTEVETYQEEGQLYLRTKYRTPAGGKFGGGSTFEDTYRVWFSPGYESFTAELLKRNVK